MLFGVRLGVWGGAVWGALRVTVLVLLCILTVGCTGAAVWGAGAGGVLGCGAICNIDARVLSGMQVTVQAHFCILTVGMQLGVLVQVAF